MTAFPTFAEFFGALNDGKSPYLWQTQAADRIYAGDPPQGIAVPTGLGKTQIMTAWVWAFARQCHDRATGGPAQRTVHTRLHFLVDRRVVIDDVHATALGIKERIKEALESEPGGPLGIAARALVATSTPWDGLLGVVALRGGLPVRPEHTRSPFTPTIAVGTLDLVVSRLLWRGYGLSTERRPIDAALVGVDSLIVLDEAHIAAQSLHTLRTLVEHRDHLDSGCLPKLSLVVMSATLPPGSIPGAITFDPDAEVAAHPNLQERLLKRRTTTIDVDWLVYPETGTPAARKKLAVEDLVGVMADHVVKSLTGPGTATVAFVNTVEHAHRLGADLGNRLDGTDTTVVVLHGGAPAPVTEQRLKAIEAFQNAAPAAVRAAAVQTVVVATQTLEVGADLDFDHAVIECPSLDALVQRIGRVNRGGKRTGATVRVVARRGDPAPVYGTTVIEQTGAIVESTATIGALDKVVADGLPPAAVRAREQVLTLDRPTFDDYTFTRGLSGEPAVGSWIRAKDSPFRVQVVWREALAAIPLEAYERYAREVPARGWESWSIRPDLLAAALKTPMSAEKNKDVGVVVITPGPEQDRVRSFAGKAAYPDMVAALTPSATVYVATPLGGVEDYQDSGVDLSGFRLTGEEPVVVVVADDPRRTSGVVTLPGGAPDLALPESEIDALVRAALCAGTAAPTKTEDGSLAQRAAALLTGQVDHVAHAERQIVTPVVGGQVWFVTSLKPHTESVADGCLTLSGHLKDVGEKAADWARTLGFDAPTVQALQLAGTRHDLGKKLTEFQTSLRYELVGRDLVLHRGDEAVRAKSTLPRWRMAEANRLARVPDGFRHEALSVALSDELGYPGGVDRALVRHLIGSHHGHGRGMFQVHGDAGRVASYQVEDHTVHTANDLQAGLSNEWATQFHDLNVTYGAYGLAFLETVLRLADWSASAGDGSPS